MLKGSLDERSILESRCGILRGGVTASSSGL